MENQYGCVISVDSIVLVENATISSVNIISCHRPI